MAGFLRRIPRWLHQRRYTVAAICVIGGAVALRLALALAGWPGIDSDSATMGLMARHILLRGERPIFFWGQAYMGGVEAYVAAPLFALFGSSPATLELGLILLYAAFLVVMFLLLRLLFDQRWALVGLIFLSLGGPAIFSLLLSAYGGYLETLLFGALLILIACYLLRSENAGARPRRLALLCTWGFVAGFALYSDPLVAPFVILSALALIFVLHRQLLSKVGLLVCLSFLIGVSPWAIYVATSGTPNAARSFWQHPPTAAQTRIPGGATTAAPTFASAAETHLLGVVVVAVPDMTGGMNLCPGAPEISWPPDRWQTPSTRTCAIARGLWGGAVLVMLLLTLLAEVAALRKLFRRAPQDWSDEERRQATRAIGRSLAIAAPLSTLILFSVSSASATVPWIFARYVVTLLIAFPVVLATAGAFIARRIPRRAVRLSIGAALLLCLLALQVSGAVATLQRVQAQQRANAQQMDLVQRLLARHDDSVYSEFWTCYRTAFLSNERIVCSVLDANFTQKPNRYPPYDTIVQAAHPPVFVFPLGISQARYFPQLASQRGWRYTTTIVDNQWVIYEVNPSACCASAQQTARWAPRSAL